MSPQVPRPDARVVRVAALQMSFGADPALNVARVERAIREAAAGGAQIILPSELFEGLYFPQVEHPDHFALARPLDGHPTLARLASLARELGVVIAASFFERAGNAYYNSVAVLDADGTVAGVYRKSHIPDGPGYEEKFYFSPGDTGFRVFPTRHARLGVGICWDQWFPEAARALVLRGAEVLLYPTAIGSEPDEPELDTRAPWRRVMQGHAVANCVPIVAANRVGREGGIDFYGHSFVCDPLGEVIASAGEEDGAIVAATLDLAEIDGLRASWGFFRDRRPDLYGVLLTRDGETEIPT